MTDTTNAALEELPGALDFFDPEDIAGVFENPLAQLPEQDTITLLMDEMAVLRGTIGRTEVEAYVTFRGGQLTRVSKIWQEPRQRADGPAKQPYWVASTVMQNVRFDITIMIKGKEVSLTEYFRRYANARVDPEYQYSQDRFNAILASTYGMGTASRGGMSMFTQHLGALEDGIDGLIEQFRKVTDSYDDVVHRPDKNWRNIQQAWTLPEAHPGFKVTAVTLGKMDRDRSATHQGFVDLVEAQTGAFFDSVGKIIAAERHADDLRKKVEAGDRTTTEAWIREQRAKISQLRKYASQNRRTWGGVQARHRYDEAVNDYVDTGEPQNVNVPVGRFNAEFTDGIEQQVSFWRNSNQQQDETGPALSASIGGTSTDPGEVAASLLADAEADLSSYTPDEEPF